MPDPIKTSAAVVDLSPRVFQNSTVVGSPAAATITIVGSITINEDVAITEGVHLVCSGAFTVGASGVSVLLQIRKTDASGTVIGTTGAVTYTAADLGSLTVQAFDTSPSVPGQVYVLCATVASGAAASTFSAVRMFAIAV